MATKPERKRRGFLNRRFKEEKQTGFGSDANTMGDRLVLPDGTYNVKRIGIPLSARLSPFHSLITMPWSHFIFIILFSFILLNLFFAVIYYLVGFDQFIGFAFNHDPGKFLDLLSFSAQTLTTVGYGRINPIGIWADLISSIEALTGLMGFALVTGLLYGRFSRPQAKILTAPQAIIAPFQSHNAFMFRIANSRSNQLLECEIVVLMSVYNHENNHRSFINLNLEYAKINALALSWTVVHPINEQSPLWGMDETTFKELKPEFIALFKAYDDTYSQHIHTRFSYGYNEVKWGAKYIRMYRKDKDSTGTLLDISQLGEIETAPLNPIANLTEDPANENAN